MSLAAAKGEDLYDAELPFEVIPGITSVIGGLAYAGIPITHRDCGLRSMSSPGILKSNAYDGASSLDWPVPEQLKGHHRLFNGRQKSGKDL